MSTYAGEDNCTDTILDFIRGGTPDHPSGEAGGNYNAYFGHVNSTVALTSMSLDSIYAFQSDMLRRDRRSSAVGGYQFLRRTLRGLQARKRLSSTTIFTERLQDELAVALLVGRGYPAWWRGSLINAHFAHNISLEWASLPDPLNGGRSAYDGDGLNSTDTTLDAVYTMLDRARTLKPNTATPG